MTSDDVKQRVEKIREMARDSEAAHSMEDDLYKDVLKFMSEYGCLGDCCLDKSIIEEALKAEKIEFERWYA